MEIRLNEKDKMMSLIAKKRKEIEEKKREAMEEQIALSDPFFDGALPGVSFFVRG